MFSRPTKDKSLNSILSGQQITDDELPELGFIGGFGIGRTVTMRMKFTKAARSCHRFPEQMHKLI